MLQCSGHTQRALRKIASPGLATQSFQVLGSVSLNSIGEDGKSGEAEAWSEKNPNRKGSDGDRFEDESAPCWELQNPFITSLLIVCPTKGVESSG